MIYTDFSQIPRRHYNVVEADPAWHHKSYSVKGQRRSPSRYYKTMTLEEICALPVKEIAHKNCHLMLWTTQPHLQQSFDVLRAWGFKYSSCYIFWLKLNPKSADVIWMRASDFHTGMGFTTRKNVEIVLLGRRGSPKRLAKNLPDYLIAARRQHSRKPDAFYDHVRQYAAGPRISLFTRETREGFDSWGDEADKFDKKATGRISPNLKPLVGDYMFGPPWPWPTVPLLEPTPV